MADQNVLTEASARKNSKLYDYCFHQVISEINYARQAEGKSVITVSRARRLRNEVARNLKDSYGTGFVNSKPVQFMTAVNAVMSQESDTPVFDGTAMGTNGMGRFRSYFDQYLSYTGFNEKGKSASSKSPGKLPESPYDPANSGMEVFMANGSQLLFSDVNQMLWDPNVQKSYSLDYGNWKFRDAGVGPSRSDRSGMSRLMPFIPASDYNMLADWVNSDPQERYMDKNAVDRSVAILQYLQDSGYDFEIKKDRNPGQLVADIKGTRTSVRIADTANNSNYVGSVYDDGRRIYFATTPTQDKRQFDITPDDSVNLLRFALGESIMRKDINRPVGQFGSYQSGKFSRPNSYRTDKAGYSAIYKSIQENGRDTFDKVTIHMDNNRQGDNVRFADGAQAEEYLRGAVKSARDSFMESIEVDRLLEEAANHNGDDAYMPDFSGDEVVASIQQAYWDVLSGRSDTLLAVGVMAEEYNETMNVLGESGLSGSAVDSFLSGGMTYSGTPEERVRAHLLDLTDEMIGQYDLDDRYQRFDPSKVAQYMVSGTGVYRNSDNLITAMRAVGMNADELKGNEYANVQVKNRLIQFNERTARRMGEIGDPFVQSMYKTIKQSLAETGCDIKDSNILMDDQGIVRYTGTRTKNWKNPVQEEISGEIGQIFVPDALGMVETKFAGGDNYIFVPGYNATVIPNRNGENLSLEERTRLHGYEQEMKRGIAYQIRSDLMSSGNQFGNPTSINRVHHQMYDTRYPIDVIERAMQTDGMRRDVFDATIKTLSKRVRYGNEFKDGSTINADFQSKRNDGIRDAANDNFMDPYSLSGGRNMSVMDESAFGYFDPIATATSVNQGIVRFLTEDAEVTDDGRIVPGSKDGKTSLMKIDEMRYAEYSPFDRQQMVFSNLMTARAIANDVHMAQMTFGGWGCDDGYVVSREFAEKYQIRDTEGKLRPMVKGDKICDFGGNKGVIGLVVDRELHSSKIAEKLNILEDTLQMGNDPDGMTSTGKVEYKGKQYDVFFDARLEDADEIQAAKQIQEQLGYAECDTAIEWFIANPELEVVGAPFPAVSRFNASSDRMLMEHPQDLVGPDGTVYEGCMGTTSFIVTDMPVDEKTHNYGDDEFAEGKGRKASSQFAWAMASQDAQDVLNECYSTNSGALSNLREISITMGLDVDEMGNLHVGYAPHEGESRTIFRIPELQYRKTSAGDKLDTARMKREFGNVIQNSGGILEIPFELEYPAGNKTMPLTEDKTGIVHEDRSFANAGYVDAEGRYVPGQAYTGNVVGKPGNTYGLPILSSHLRSGQEFADGTVTRHDYTNNYSAIYEASIKYLDEQAKGEDANPLLLSQYKGDAQRSFNQITGDLRTRKFDNNKHNIFKDSLMSNRMPNSATTVWTADPRLDIDQVAMGPETAKTLGIKKDDDYAVIWRDPLLRDGGVKYMRVKIDPTLHGAAINPAMDRTFDGDFDGDSNADLALKTKAAKAEAMRKLSVNSNLLDYGLPSKNCDGFSTVLQSGLDLASAYYAHPELATEMKSIEKRINEFESNDSLNEKQLTDLRSQAVRDLSDHVRKSFAGEFGTNMISYKDHESHMRSIEHVVTVGAKGSYSKLADYMVYMGYSADMIMGDDGKPCGIDYSTFKDNGDTRATYQNHKDSMYAQACKSFGTGVAGKYSQRGIAALRNVCAKAVLECTYVNTQGMLQAKHDPKDAAHRYDMLQTCVRSLWRGYKLERGVDNEGNAIWTEVRDPNTRKPVVATPDEFKAQFRDVYGKSGLDVPLNDEYVNRICESLTKDGRILNIEQDDIPGCSTLDKLTYGGGFDAVVSAANSRKNLFEGKYTKCFAPSSIRKNWDCAAKGDIGVKGIVKSDVKQGYKSVVKTKLATTVITSRRMPAGGECEAQTVDMQEGIDGLG